MPIFARRKESQFDPAPEGLHAAVCADVWEPWTEERPEEWGGGLVDKTRIVWLIEEMNPKTHKPFEVSQIYTLSLHEKAKLTAHLETWRGKRFTEQEKQGFDIEKLIGVGCQIQVIHKIKDTATYANVSAVLPLGKGQPKLSIPVGYVRKKDRAATQDGNGPQIADDEVPF
jgi:hypothetical protein